MKVLVSGFLGHMGTVLSDMIRNDNDLTIACGVSKSAKEKNFKSAFGEIIFGNFADVNVDVDIIIDFSHHSFTKDMVDYAVSKSIPIVIATTGQTDEEKNIINEASKKIPVFFAANYSIGVAVLIDAAKRVVSQMENADIEIVETHHNRKLDAPSGTALKIAEAIKEIKSEAHIVKGRNGNTKREKNDIGISAIRLGNVVGIHEVMISTDHECITLKHEAYDRGLFAEGAIKAAKFLYGKPAGFYDMKNLTESNM